MWQPSGRTLVSHDAPERILGRVRAGNIQQQVKVDRLQELGLGRIPKDDNSRGLSAVAGNWSIKRVGKVSSVVHRPVIHTAEQLPRDIRHLGHHRRQQWLRSDIAGPVEEAGIERNLAPLSAVEDVVELLDRGVGRDGERPNHVLLGDRFFLSTLKDDYPSVLGSLRPIAIYIR